MIKTSKKYQLALDGLEEGCHLHPPSEIHLLRATLANAMSLGCDPPPIISQIANGEKNYYIPLYWVVKGIFHKLDHKYPNTSHNQM